VGRWRGNFPEIGIAGGFPKDLKKWILTVVVNVKTEAVICFDSVSEAIMAEQALLAEGFNVRVMPKPSGIKAGCGFCLRFPPCDIEKAAAFLSKRGVHVNEIYLAEEAGGALLYKKIRAGLDETP
jgi:hypothetical protein